VKITRVEPFHVDWGGGRSRSAWVRVWSDAGVYGLGEASPMVHGNASLEIIASALAPMLLGADPLEARVIQDRLFHEHIKVGPEGAYAGALAAIDIALWDLKGKALGQPGDASCPSTPPSAATAGAAWTRSAAWWRRGSSSATPR
jgi:D-galactarolactone cycloisomerase